MKRSVGIGSVERVVIVTSIIAAGCSNRQDAVVATQSTEKPEVAPTFNGAPALVGEESRTCDLTSYVTDDESFLAAVGKTPGDIAANIDVSYQSTLSWETLAPFLKDVPVEELVNVSVTHRGSARLYRSCSNYIELDVQLVAASESGTLSFDAPGVVSYTQPDQYRARGRVSSGVLSNLNEVLRSITMHEPTGFSLDIDLVRTGMGNFQVLGPGQSACRLAQWPAQRHCELGESAILPGESFLDLRTEYVVEGLDVIEKGHPIQWEDIRSGAMMTVDFITDDSGLACVAPAGVGADGEAQFTYSVPGSVHLVTDDGRLDVVLPSRARTRGREGAWSAIEISAATAVAPPVGFGVVPGSDNSKPERRAVVAFNSPIEFSEGLLLGGVDVQFVELVSPSATPTPGSCIADDFMGLVSDVLTAASYVTAQP